MLSFFSPDSLPMRFMSRIGDLLVLNFLFLLCCIPVVTIGAAWTALLCVCLRFDTEKEDGLLRSYFCAFRENFRQSTGLWLLLLLGGSTTAVNVCLFYVLPGALRYGCVLFGAMFLLVLMTGGYVFPLVCQFSNHWKTTLKNAVFLSIGHFPRSLAVTALNIAPFAFLLLDFYRFLQLGFLWAALYFSAAAYLNTILLKSVFAPYLSEEGSHDRA